MSSPETARPTVVVAPDPQTHGPGPYPGVVVLHDITGTGDDLAANVARIAGQGYLVAAPDLFAGRRQPGCIVRAARDLVRQSGPTVEIVHEARDVLRAHPAASGAVGVVGFCLGGGFALLTSPVFDAAAPFYGVLPTHRDRVLDEACPVVASYGRRDWMLPGEGRRLEKALAKRGVPHDVTTYPGVGHSFANQLDLGRWTPVARVSGFRYDAAATEDAWRRVFAFFDKHLAPDSTI